MDSTPPYQYVRWTWWKNYKITELTEKLKGLFTITLRKNLDPEGEARIPINMRNIPQIEVKADTLHAHLAPSKAVLFQKEKALFTKRDMALREIILTLYSHDSSTPLPLFYRKEPEFFREES